MTDDWGELPDPEVDVTKTDLEMLRETRARDILTLPLGCRMELLTRESVLVSIGMRARATFNADEWVTMLALHEDGGALPSKMSEWLIKKAHSKGEFRIWLDKDVVFDTDKAQLESKKTWPTTVGDVLDAWGMTLRRVTTEI